MSSLDDICWKQCVFICIWINSKNNKANCMSECILSRRMDAKHVDSSQPNLLGAIAPRRFGATNLLFLVHSPWLNHSTFIIQRSSLYLHQSVRGGAILGQLKHLDSTCTRFLDLLMRHFVPVLIGGICLSKNCTHIINIQHSWHTLPCHKRTRDNLGDISWVHNSSNYPWWPEQMEPIR